MLTWFSYLRRALTRKLPAEQIGKQDNKVGSLSHLKNLYPFVFRHWKKGAVGFIIIILTSLLSYPQPLINRFLIDNVLIAKQFNLLIAVILVMLALKIFQMGSGTFQQFFFTRFEQEVLLDIRHDLLNRVLHFPKAFFDSKETGYLMSRLSSDIEGLRWFFSSTIVQIISTFLRFFVGIGILFYLEWRIALVCTILLPTLFFYVRYFSRKVKTLSHVTYEFSANVTRRMQESLSSITLIKSHASEKREIGRIMQAVKDSYQMALENMALSSISNLLINSISEIAGLIVIIWGGILIIRGEWSVGSLLAFQSYLGFVYGPATYLANINLTLQNALVALERVGAFYNVFPEKRNENGLKVEKLKGKIEFKNVVFSYDESEIVLDNLSFIIHPGERIAIVGPSGVGKTTLVSLILAFYLPTHGQILFDDCPLSEYALKSLRKRIGYVSQTTKLLSGTILDNIKYGNPDASDQEAEQAAKVAEIHDFISQQPNGYHAIMGENGVNLSEGQRQRLSIARALLKNPDILILDEPTSQLDTITEKSIFEALPSIVKEKTIIVIAHRLSTIQNSDRILVLNNKQLVGMDTHAALLENNPFYRALVNSHPG